MSEVLPIMSAVVFLSLKFYVPPTVTASADALKSAGWHVSHNGSVTFLIDRANDYSWQYTSPDAEFDTFKLLERELASGAKVGIRFCLNEEEDYQVYLIYDDPLSITANITADRRVLDVGNDLELIDVSWYIQHLVQPLYIAQPNVQLEHFGWSELP